MDLKTLGLLVGGLVLLIVGADALVRGASKLAAGLGISPLVIGLTVVAYGTSAPEMAVSVQAALAGGTGVDIALGNVVGSNIFNVLFILGLSALIVPLAVSQQLVRIDVPIMVGVSLLALMLARDGRVGRVEGLILIAGIAAYSLLAVAQGRRESRDVQQEYAEEFGDRPRGAAPTVLNAVLVLLGLGLLVLGSGWFVDGAIALARSLGLSELIIGLTIVAAGTSMPEVATSILASIKGERDIAVGNVVGSNIFNILGVLGVSAVVAPGGLPVQQSVLSFDVPVMIAAAVACMPIFFTGYRIARLEGAVFLGYYAAYTAYLVLAAQSHDALPFFSDVMLWFVVPLTILTLGVAVVRALRQRAPA
jgi:cation:H+ antiporter